MILDEPPVLPRPVPALRLPVARPRVTYLLLALIALVFIAESALGGSANIFTLRMLGAQINPLVARGEHWRLFSALFLHIGLMHVAFNGWALFSLGRDVEAFYGSLRFTLLYFLSGLGGGVLYYLLGSSALSAGASGAVFGLVGAEIAYFLCNRDLFGAFGRQRLANLATLVGVNLLFGFTVPGINNLAHMGGLLTGLALGLGLCPHYRVVWEWLGFYPSPRLVNRTPLWQQVVAVLAAVALIWAGLRLGDQRWGIRATILREETAVVAATGSQRAQDQSRDLRLVTCTLPEVNYVCGSEPCYPAIRYRGQLVPCQPRRLASYH